MQDVSLQSIAGQIERVLDRLGAVEAQITVQIELATRRNAAVVELCYRLRAEALRAGVD